MITGVKSCSNGNNKLLKALIEFVSGEAVFTWVGCFVRDTRSFLWKKAITFLTLIEWAILVPTIADYCVRVAGGYKAAPIPA